MRVVAAAEIDAVLDEGSVVEAVAAAFRGGDTAPERHHHTVPGPDGGGATLLLMPAWTGGPAPTPYLGVKAVSVFPGNGSRGLPSVQGTYLLLDGTTGAPLAAMDGARLTLWRTAAASALAARYLAREDATELVIVGAGALAPFLARAHAAIRPLSRITIWNRDPARARATAAVVRGHLGAEVTVSEDLEAAVRAADIVSCATLSTTPLVRGAWLSPGAHLDLVGAFTLAMREADDEALTRATVFVDTPAALTEGGDVAVALRAGRLSREAIAGDLASLAGGAHPGRTAPEEITAFKSVGAAIEDLAAAALVWERLGTA